MPLVPATQLKDYIGKELGCSAWLTIDQARIDQFAACTGDQQFIHVDPERAKLTPFGSTIAHGQLTLSLLPLLMQDLMIIPQGLKMAINYGFDTVRFIQPVKVNANVRLRLSLLDAYEKKPGQWLVKSKAALEIEGVSQPAYIAEKLTLYFV
jgi:acyl dehydratase